MFNADMLSFVTNVPSKLISPNAFLFGLSVSFPLIACISLFALVLLMIRNRENQIASLAIYAFLAAATWIFLLPFSLSFLSDFQSENESLSLNKNATSIGIFRENDAGVFYNSRIREDGNVDGIFIDTTGYLGEEGELEPFYDLPVNNSDAYPYSDILVKKALEPPKYVTYPLAVYTSLLTAAANSQRSGFFAWLFFASFGLALASTYGLQYLSSWRLCSALSVAIGQILIVFINYFYYMGFFPSWMIEFDKMISEKFSVSLENSLILVVNFLIAAVLLIFGISMGIYRTKKANRIKNGENR